MKLSFRREPPAWPKFLGAAAVGGLATLFVARNFFPAEKKVRHRIEADYQPGDDAFKRTMGNMLGPPLLEGNRITPLENGDQIFPAPTSFPTISAERALHLRTAHVHRSPLARMASDHYPLVADLVLAKM